MKLLGWKLVTAIFLLCIATVIASPAQVFENLFAFNAADGQYPADSLVQGTDGNLYGTTTGGGPHGWGTVFRVTKEGVLTTIYDFCSQPNCADGANPVASLTLGTDGNFYGTTYNGGMDGYCNFGSCGTVFKITSKGILTTLHRFDLIDGGNPVGNVIQAADGNFYGTTFFSYSTVFRMTSAGALTTLYTFCSLPDCADGIGPMAGLIQAADGNFYGTTAYGGAPHSGCYSACGTVFRITPQGTLTTIHTFDGSDGGNPFAPLLEATDGDLYGTTEEGGNNRMGPGTVFSITPKGRLTTIHYFCTQPGCADGANPYAGVIEGTDGNLYGTASAAGANQGEGCVDSGCGTVFSINPGGTLTTVHNFCGQGGYDLCTDGARPQSGLLQATNGIFYGMTYLGGGNTDGTIFSLSMGLSPFVAFVQPAGKVGQTGGILGQGFTGTTSVSLNGVQATFKVVSDTFIRATVPPGATTGYVTVVTPSGTLTSNVPFRVLQ